MARPTKLTDAMQQAIVQAVTAGVPYVQACLLAGVGEGTAHEWRARGEQRDPVRPSTPLYAQFAEAIRKAEAHDEALRLARISAAGKGGTVVYEKTVTYPDGRTVREVQRTAPQWTADAWHLERKYPECYGRRDRYDLHVQIEQAAARVAADLGMTPEALLAKATALLQELPHVS
jgi:transposase